MEQESKRVPVYGKLIEKSLTYDDAEAILKQVATNEKITQDTSLDLLVSSFATDQALDSYDIICQLSEASPALSQLLRSHTGVRETYRLHEHTQAVLNGFQQDYMHYFSDTSDRKIIRTALLLQDIGKSLCVAHCQDRHRQSTYNAIVADNILSSITSEALIADEKQVIRLLIDHDIIGDTLKTYTETSEDLARERVSEIEQACPARYREKCRTFMRVIYLSDITAYTSFRSYICAETGRETACLPGLDEDFPILTQLSNGVIEFVDEESNAILDRLTPILK